MRSHAVFLLLILILTACLPTPQPSDSGIEGVVTIGPMCPVVQQNVPCPDQPYQASLTVMTPNGKKVTKFQTEGNGNFRVALAPGDYLLHPEPGTGLHTAQDVPFSVSEHTFTHLQISYDSGIR